MAIGTRYFGLLDPEFRRVVSVFRLRETRDELHVERYDPIAAAWTAGPSSLFRFVNGGEVGADEISKADAEALIANGLPELPIPV